MKDYKVTRDSSFDALRGMAILAVVSIHSSLQGINIAVVPNPLTHNLISLILYRQLLIFGVPVFIFISGYWMAKLGCFSRHNYWASITKRLPKILVPYLFWSLLIVALNVFNGQKTGVKAVAFQLVTGGVSIQFYFVILIVQLYLLTPVLMEPKFSKVSTAAVVVVNCLGVLSLYYIRLWLGYEIPFWAYAAPFYSWVIFYYLGLWFGGDHLSIQDIGTPILLLAIIVGILLSLLEGCFLVLSCHNWNFALSSLKASSFVYSLSFILLAYKYKRYLAKISILVQLGRVSFGIYLIHLLFLPVACKLVNKYSAFHLVYPVYQLLVIVATISLCMITIIFANRILPQEISSFIMGFSYRSKEEVRFRP